jgi:RNA polymerase sigma-70 factor (ECF subfamily)
VSRITDEELVSAVQGGDMDSLGVLVARWEQPLYRFVSRMLPRSEDARDVCQETFLRILNRADRFRRGSRFSTWMYQIALNQCRDQARRRRRWGKILDDTKEAPTETAAASGTRAGNDPEADTERGELAHAVRLGLAQIPAEQREVLILKEYEGLKFKEIAEILSCPESTVKSRMYYGLNGLKNALSRQGIR